MSHRGATAGTCAYVQVTYCEDMYDCVAGGEDRSFYCAGHDRQNCTEPAYMNLDYPTPSKGLLRIYGCVNHWEAMLIDLNDFPPDPGYGRARATFYSPKT